MINSPLLKVSGQLSKYYIHHISHLIWFLERNVVSHNINYFILCYQTWSFLTQLFSYAVQLQSTMQSSRCINKFQNIHHSSSKTLTMTVKPNEFCFLSSFTFYLNWQVKKIKISPNQFPHLLCIHFLLRARLTLRP